MYKTPDDVLDSAADLPWEPEAPGYFIKTDILDAHGMTQQQLADRLHVTRRTVNELVGGKRSLSTDMALRLSQLTGQSAAYWLSLQTQYDLWHAERETARVDIEPLVA